MGFVSHILAIDVGSVPIGNRRNTCLERKSTSYALELADAELVGERYVAPAVLMALRKR